MAVTSAWKTERLWQRLILFCMMSEFVSREFILVELNTAYRACSPLFVLWIVYFTTDCVDCDERIA